MQSFRPWRAEDACYGAFTCRNNARNWGVKEGGGCLLKGAVLSGATCREELRSSVLHIIEHVSTVIVLTVMISLLYTLAHTTVPNPKYVMGKVC